MKIVKIMKKPGFNKWLSQLSLILAGIIGYMIMTNFAIIGAWISTLFGYLSPFFAGAIIAYLLDIPCSKFENVLLKRKNEFIKKRSRGLSIIFTLSVCLILIAISVGMLIPQLIRSVTDFIQYFPNYYANTINFIKSIETGDLGLGSTVEYLLNSLFDSISQIDLKNTLNFNFLWDSIRTVLSVSTYMINVIVAIITSIYLLLDKKNMNNFFKKLFYAFAPEKSSKVLSKYLSNTNAYFKKFLYCNTVDGIIVGIVSIIGLTIVRVKYGVILGVIGGITNMIPYFGAIFGSVFVTIVVLMTDGLGKALIVGLFLFVLQTIDGNVIKPKLYGGSFNISPFLVILSIVIGGSYWGVIGMVIAIPMTAIIKNIINDLLEYRIRKKSEKESQEETTKEVIVAEEAIIVVEEKEL